MTRGTLCGCLAIILTGCMSAHAQDVSVQALLQKIAELEQRVQELKAARVIRIWIPVSLNWSRS